MTEYSVTIRSYGKNLLIYRGEHLVNFNADHSEVIGLFDTLS